MKQISRTWKWNIPEFFNIGQACTASHKNKENEEKIAMIVEDDELGNSEITYQELNHRSNQFGQLLVNLGIKIQDRVLIRLPNSLDYPISFLGAMKCGAISVPTSTLLAPEELVYIIKDSGARALVIDKKAWQFIQPELQKSDCKNLRFILLSGKGEFQSQEQFILLDIHEELNKITAINPFYKTKAEDPAYLVYTSGTTGYPKGVLHAHRALIGRGPASQYWFDFHSSGDDRILHSGKFNWTYVLGSGLMDPLYLGKTVIVYEGKNDANTWIQLIKKHQATIFIGVPTIYRQLIQKTTATKKDVPSLRYCMSAGEHLSDEVFRFWNERFELNIYEAVGMSEFSYYLSQNKYAPIKPGSAGFPQPGHAIQLIDIETLEPVPPGEEGMICVPSNDPGLFLRYWNLEEETKKYVHDDWFFTGDYARYDTEGYIWFLGRKDDIIKSFGYRVSPYEIERVYKSHPDIADCAAIGEEIEKDKILVTAYIIPHANVSIDPNDLINFGKKHLAAYKAPKTIYLTKEFPRTKNGKILRKDINNSIAFAKSESQK
jgi:acyl-coenzyme A synthetase/AMP-(fatty) acid ligase